MTMHHFGAAAPPALRATHLVAATYNELSCTGYLHANVSTAAHA